MPRRLTQEEFVERATKVHNGKYDYSKVEYKGTSFKVCIVCPIHGEFWQNASHHLKGHICPLCSRQNRRVPALTVGVEEFKKRAKLVHMGKYDYSLVDMYYISDLIEIICPEHGIFKQVAYTHLRGSGCPMCAKNIISVKNRKDSIYNRAEHDIFINDGGVVCSIWRRMLDRCYSEYYHKHNPSYKGCSVCDEWLKLSNFYNWVIKEENGYREGYHLDKDILIKGNKVYSPETCCFVPSEINELFIRMNKGENQRKGYTLTKSGKFYVRIYSMGKYLKGVTFDNIKDAIDFYRKNKEANIKLIAQKYFDEGKITEKVYKALLNYEVEITD